MSAPGQTTARGHHLLLITLVILMVGAVFVRRAARPAAGQAFPFALYTGESPGLFRTKLEFLPGRRFGFVLHGCIPGQDHHATGRYDRTERGFLLTPDVPAPNSPLCLEYRFLHPGSDETLVRADEFDKADGFVLRYQKTSPQGGVPLWFGLDDRAYRLAADGTILDVYDLPKNPRYAIRAEYPGGRTAPFEASFDGPALVLRGRDGSVFRAYRAGTQW